MRDEKEGREKQARSNKQQGKDMYMHAQFGCPQHGWPGGWGGVR